MALTIISSNILDKISGLLQNGDHQTLAERIDCSDRWIRSIFAGTASPLSLKVVEESLKLISERLYDCPVGYNLTNTKMVIWTEGFLSRYHISGVHLIKNFLIFESESVKVKFIKIILTSKEAKIADDLIIYLLKKTEPFNLV